jgi:deoxyribodipyrimidine photo-lyase
LFEEQLSALNEKPVGRGDYVLYWLQLSQRTVDNPALVYAIRQANELQLPLVTIAVLPTEKVPSNPRQYEFTLQGLMETYGELKALNIEPVFIAAEIIESVSLLAQNAALIVTIRAYLNASRQWRKTLAERVPCRLVQIDSNSFFPPTLLMQKEAYNAKVIRDRIYKLLPTYQLELNEAKPVQTKLDETKRKKLYDLLPNKKPLSLQEMQETSRGTLIGDVLNQRFDFHISPATFYRGGYSQAKANLKYFIEHSLQDYYAKKSDPGTDYQSKLSPYLTFGQISIREVILEIIKSLNMPPTKFFKLVVSTKPGVHANAKVNGALAFFEEAVVRRELSINFCHFNHDYDQYAALPLWARTTLREHSADYRPYTYTPAALENAETHDIFWNTAQKELVITGKMHGYMRMYWGKKILEWSKDPEEAFQIALYLNSRYELDGLDPNGYAGVAWCFGKHDRAWSEFPIFGKVRSMTESGLTRKFDMGSYIKRISIL